MFIADLREIFRNHLELRNEDLALQHIYAEIQQSLVLQNTLQADMNLPSLFDQKQQEGLADPQFKVEQAILKFNREQRNMSIETVGALLSGLSCLNLNGNPGRLRADELLLSFVDALGDTGKTFVTSAMQ